MARVNLASEHHGTVWACQTTTFDEGEGREWGSFATHAAFATRTEAMPLGALFENRRKFEIFATRWTKACHIVGKSKFLPRNGLNSARSSATRQ